MHRIRAKTAARLDYSMQALISMAAAAVSSLQAFASSSI